jgi:hypothetical protein
MEAIRTIVNANLLTQIIDLPWPTKDMQVEVIVIPLIENANHRTVSHKNLKGCLKKYANPALLEKEASAWENHIVEKYAVT